MPVPEVLLGGHHRNIHLWQFEESLRLTYERRPDLFEIFLRNETEDLQKDEKKVLEKILLEIAD